MNNLKIKIICLLFQKHCCYDKGGVEVVFYGGGNQKQTPSVPYLRLS